MLTTTNTLLLEGLAEPANEEVWHVFHDRYRPVLIGFARRLGLSAEDARDAAQETLLRFVQDYRADKYERERGRLRSWIFAIARSRVLDLRRESARRAGWRGESALGEPWLDSELEELWEAEWRGAVVRRGLNELREDSGVEQQTIRVLQLLLLDQRTPDETAAQLGMTRNAVYVAKHRALKQLRGILSRLTEEF